MIMQSELKGMEYEDRSFNISTLGQEIDYIKKKQQIRKDGMDTNSMGNSPVKVAATKDSRSQLLLNSEERKNVGEHLKTQQENLNGLDKVKEYDEQSRSLSEKISTNSPLKKTASIVLEEQNRSDVLTEVDLNVMSEYNSRIEQPHVVFVEVQMSATDQYTIGVKSGDSPLEVATSFLERHRIKTNNHKLLNLKYDLANIIKLKIDESKQNNNMNKDY